MSTPLVYIGGSGRSGSTLLERMLASIPGFCPVGELVFIWERGLQRNDLCGCGERFRDCAFWDQVGKTGFGGWDQVDVNEAVWLRRTLDRHRNLDRIAGIRRPGKLAAAMTAYADLTGRLYRGVRDTSGCEVIVDSSKHASYALLLRDLEDFEVHLVHLIRRSHGVAHSWTKRVRKPGVGDGDTFMSVHSSWWAVGLWITDNVLFDVTARGMPRAIRVRYEDLITDPRAEVLRILNTLALPRPQQALSALDESAPQLPVAHALSGNPIRFQRGPLQLRIDDEWLASMSRPRRVAISVATWPLLMRYGYAIGPRDRPRP